MSLITKDFACGLYPYYTISLPGTLIPAASHYPSPLQSPLPAALRAFSLAPFPIPFYGGAFLGIARFVRGVIWVIS